MWFILIGNQLTLFDRPFQEHLYKKTTQYLNLKTFCFLIGNSVKVATSNATSHYLNTR